MRFMIIRKADAATESDTDNQPSAELLNAMAEYNMEMIKAGVFLTGDGLHPSSKGARVKISRDGAAPIVTDGPFAETKELVAGFTIIKAESLEAALEWVRRWPKEDGPVELEVRRIYEFEDFDIAEDDKSEPWIEMEKAFQGREGSA